MQFNVRRMKIAKPSAYDGLSVSEVKRTVELSAYPLRLDGFAAVLCAANQFGILHRMLAIAPCTQRDGSFFLSSFRSKRSFRLGAAPLTAVDCRSHYHSSPVKQSFLLVTAVEFALHLEKNEILFAEKKKQLPISISGL